MNRKIGLILLAVALSTMAGVVSCINIYPSSPQGITTPTTNPQTTPTPADNQGINPQVTPTPAITATATPTVPNVPAIPSDVLSIWKSEPASESLTPYAAGEVVLKLNTYGNPSVSSIGSGDMNVSYYAISEGADQTTSRFYLEEGQWIDVVVSSVNIPIYFRNNKPGGVSFNSMCWDPVSGNQLAKALGVTAIPNAFHHPYSEKTLYENEATGTYVGSASSHKATLFSTAARIFAWGGAGDYAFNFTNFNSQRGADIQYRIYILGATPAWGNTYANTMLAPWLNELHRLSVSGSISEQEYDNVINQWLEQLK